MRLSGSYNRSSYGRVEVQFNGTWGTWCSAPWNLNNAHVTCRHLGFDGAVALRPEPLWIYDGVEWRNDLRCFGNETSLTDCPQTGFTSVRFCTFGYRATKVMCNLQGKTKHPIVHYYPRMTNFRILKFLPIYSSLSKATLKRRYNISSI